MTSKEYWRETHTLAILGIAFLVLFWNWEGVSSSVVRSQWIDLRSVYVPDHEVGGDPQLEIYRKVKRDRVPLSSTVTIRNGDDEHVCTGRSPGPDRYLLSTVRYTETGDLLPHYNKLSHWLWSEGKLAECAATGKFEAGRFYLTTCYYRTLLFRFERCVRSNDFWRSE